jgi:hypothetical protein
MKMYNDMKYKFYKDMLRLYNIFLKEVRQQNCTV